MSDGVENEERGSERVELESLWLDPASFASRLCSSRAGISSNDPVLGLPLLGGGGAPLMETIEKQDCWRKIMALGRWLVELGLTRGTEEVPPQERKSPDSQISLIRRARLRQQRCEPGFACARLRPKQLYFSGSS